MAEPAPTKEQQSENIAPATFRPQMICSGGQTGADRGALIAAAILGYEHGGWVPKGRLAEDGKVPRCYPMTEADTADYPTRTILNIECSNATAVFTYEDPATGGTKLTLRKAQEAKKPVIHIVLQPKDTLEGNLLIAKRLRAWIDEVEPRVLNVAGSRESKAPGLQTQVAEVMLLTLQTPDTCLCGRKIPSSIWETAGVKETNIPLKCSECGHITLWTDFQ